MAGFNMDDYVDVAERITLFKAEYPNGSLQSTLSAVLDEKGVLVGWMCKAYAYRDADDKLPGIGHAVEPVPGKTPYTRDSEAMNAETSAWGRAIIALGFPTKKIASRNEVQNRQADTRVEGPQPTAPPTSWAKLTELISVWDEPTHDMFMAFAEAAARSLFGPEVDTKKLAPSDKKFLLQKCAVAAVHLREAFEPSELPYPGRDDVRAAFAEVLDVELALPEEALEAEALEVAARES